MKPLRWSDVAACPTAVPLAPELGSDETCRIVEHPLSLRKSVTHSPRAVGSSSEVAPTETHRITKHSILQTVPVKRMLESPSWVLMVRFFIGFGWIRAAIAKLTSPAWVSGDTLLGFVAANEDAALLWFKPVVELVALPNIVATSATVLVLELGVGLLLVLDQKLEIALAVGIGLNLAFVLAGATNPSIFYLISQGAIGLWVLESRTPAARARSLLSLCMKLGIALSVISLPFIATLSPAEVIDDPGSVLALFGLLTSVSSFLAIQRLESQR